jgi:hypothetical protein
MFFGALQGMKHSKQVEAKYPSALNFCVEISSHHSPLPDRIFTMSKDLILERRGLDFRGVPLEPQVARVV